MVYLAPPSFDNQNGLSARNAQSESSSIYTPDGTVRSSSPGNFDNPYFLTQTAKNQGETDNFFYELKYRTGWNVGDVQCFVGGQYNAGNETMAYGTQTVAFIDGFYRSRQEKLTHYYVGGVVKNRLIDYMLRMEIPFRAEWDQRELDVSTQNIIPQEYNQIRRVLMLNPRLTFQSDNDAFFVKAGTAFFASSTADKSYLHPNLGAYFRPFRLLDDEFIWSTEQIFNEFKVAVNYSTHVNEYPLQYQAGLNNSLAYNAADLMSYMERDEIHIPDGIKPELIRKMDLMVETTLLRGKLKADFSLFNNRITNSLFPIYNAQLLEYQNVGEIENRGWEASIQAYLSDYDGLTWDANFSISRIRSTVKRLHSDGPLDVAGFKDVHKVLIEGQPTGVIMGSTHLRNEAGQLLVGDHGFPLVNGEKQVIGDPNPDLLLGLSNNFRWRGFSLGLTIDATIGGDIWNGTQSTLDYYGVSASTESQRSTVDYLFKGLRADGSVNTKTVDFAPRDGQVADNRWVRYGKTGIADEYIEDGTRAVLKQLSLAYQFRTDAIKNMGLYELKLTAFANNLWAVSKYGGIIPESNLWGHSNTSGLDYFNQPLVRSYGLSVQVTF